MGWRTMVGEADDDLHKLVVRLAGLDDLGYAVHGGRVEELHDDAVAVDVHRYGYGEPVLVQHLQRPRHTRV